jgi:hypothetical protein
LKKFVLVLFFFWASISLLYASWQREGVPICTSLGDKRYLEVASDGVGGAFLVWVDYRNDKYPDIYAQRLDKNGNVLWQKDGVPACTTKHDQAEAEVVRSEGKSAIIVWNDRRSGQNYDIYAQRVDSSGSLLWKTNGVPICTSYEDQTSPQMISDGEGGAVICWQDRRNPNQGNDIYAQKIDKDGNSIWTPNGVPISATLSDQIFPVICSDGEGGAIIAWADHRKNVLGDWDIYAQKIDSKGNILWKQNGVGVCTTPQNQGKAKIVKDGRGGAIISWLLYKEIDSDVYIQRVDSAGNTLWSPNGASVCDLAGNQNEIFMSEDGSGGAVIVWSDYRKGDYDTYAQRFDSAGKGLWGTNGIPVCSVFGPQWNPEITKLDEKRFLVTWEDNRTHNCHIYAQVLNERGNFLWDKDGIMICPVKGVQTNPKIVAGGSKDAIIAWSDRRSGEVGFFAQGIFAPLLASANPGGASPEENLYLSEDVFSSLVRNNKHWR